MTAAHKHLPLPTFVLVTNVDNGKQLVVKVNDRGPFVDDRVIDLSYGAAARLGVLDTGTARVKLLAVSSHQGEDERQNTRADVLIAENSVESAPAAAIPTPTPTTTTTTAPTPALGVVSIINSQSSDPVLISGDARPRQPINVRKTAAAEFEQQGSNNASAYVNPALSRQGSAIGTPAASSASGMVIQVGAFSERRNAEAMRQRVNRAVSDNAAIISLDDERQLHKVQIGPLPAEAPIEQILSRLRHAGIERIRLFEI